MKQYFFTDYMNDVDEFEDTWLENEEVKVIKTFAEGECIEGNCEIEFSNGETMFYDLECLDVKEGDVTCL